MKRIVSLIICAALLVGTVGCGWSKKGQGAAIGAGTGAVIGGLIGKAAGNTAAGAIAGAVLGGAAGAYIGRQMDEAAKEIERDLEGATVTRVGEGIVITFASGILFDVNSSALKAPSIQNLDKLAGILNKYSDTQVMVAGHTDSDGTEELNMTLSQNRANSVANHLEKMQVAGSRFQIRALGETDPVADNSTAEGKQANRRVEIAIFANDKLKDVAKKQVGEG